MAATPQRAAFTFVGAKTGRVYSIDAYVSDVANAAVTFDPNGSAGASSLQYWQAPASEDVVLIDYAQVTGTADTTTLVLTQGGAIRSGTVLRYTIFLTSIATRPRLSVRFPANALIGAKQLA
jgi:hypothetical protein